MPCPFTGPKMFCAGPNFLCQTKNLFTYCGSHKHFVPDKKIFAVSEIGFCACTKSFREALSSSTCALTGFFWLLSHVICLKLTKVLKECFLSQTE